MVYLRNKNLCFLEKPKCGSTSLRNSLIKSTNKATANMYITSKSLIQVKYNYNNADYRHCNLASAEKRLRNLGLLNEQTVFVALMREPIELVNSLYYFDLNSRFGNKNFIYKTIEEMVETIHYKQFIDINFFNSENEKLYLFDMYCSEGLNKFLYEKYNFQLNFQHYNKNNNNKKDLSISPILEQKIRKDFYLYYRHKEINQNDSLC